MICLDWTDICDGKIDCMNGGVDEKHCWQLEMNDCQNNEYKCYNGICLSKVFVRETNMGAMNCIHDNKKYQNIKSSPGCLSTGSCNEEICLKTFSTSTCLENNFDIISLYFINKNNISDIC